MGAVYAILSADTGEMNSFLISAFFATGKLLIICALLLCQYSVIDDTSVRKCITLIVEISELTDTLTS